MQKRSMLTRAANWQLSFLYQIRRFQNKNLGCNFQTLLARNLGLAHPFFLHENECFLHYLWYYLRRMAMFLILEVRFFQRTCFSSSPGSQSGSGFWRCPKWWAVSETSKTDARIKTMTVFRHAVYLSVTTGSHLMLEKQNYLSKGSEKAHVCWIKHGEKKLTHDERLGHENLLIKYDEILYSLCSCFL